MLFWYRACWKGQRRKGKGQTRWHFWNSRVSRLQGTLEQLTNYDHWLSSHSSQVNIWRIWRVYLTVATRLGNKMYRIFGGWQVNFSRIWNTLLVGFTFHPFDVQIWKFIPTANFQRYLRHIADFKGIKGYSMTLKCFTSLQACEAFQGSMWNMFIVTFTYVNQSEWIIYWLLDFWGQIILKTLCSFRNKF